MVTGDDSLIIEFLPDLISNYKSWVKNYRDINGLFWLSDARDGGEVSAATADLKTDTHYRLNINSFMFAEANTISQIAKYLGKHEIATQFKQEAEKLRKLIHLKLWDADSEFYKVALRVKNPDTLLSLATVREQYGYMPWYIEALDPPQEYTVAWKQLINPKGFYAPFGPTTAEQRHPVFKISYEGHECQFNGPSWPLTTSFTLTGLTNVINRNANEGLDIAWLKDAWIKTFSCYVNSHHIKLENGKVIPWIDENLNPFTGDWIARTRLKTWENGTWSDRKGGIERGKDYNHSTFCDLVITGLVGFRPSTANSFTIFPLVPPEIDYFAIDKLKYHGKMVSIVYDRKGEQFHLGKGFRIYIEDKEVYNADHLPKQPVKFVI